MKINCIATLLMGALASAPLLAAYKTSDVLQVEVTGQIVAPACQVEVPQTVDLGQIARQLLTVPGSNSVSKLVTLKFSQCSSVTTKANISFSGAPYAEDPSLANQIYANQLADGAQGIGLQLFNADGQPLVNLGNTVTYVVPVDTQTTSAQLPIVARMYTPHGNPTAGGFQTAVTLNFIYQ